MQHGHHKLEILDAPYLDEVPGEPERFSRLNGAVFFLLCVILIFSTLAYGAVETWAFGVLSILTGAVTLCWLADAWFTRELRFDGSALQLPVIGLIIIGVIQLLPLRSAETGGALSVPVVSSLSINPYTTRVAVIQLIIFLVFFAAAFTYINTAQRLRKIVTIVVIFGAVMAFFGILQRLASPEGIYGWRPTPQAIPFASFVNQHHFAAFMEMTIGLTLALLVGKATEKDKRLLLIIAIVLMGTAILLTGSRGGVLSLLGVIGFVLLSNFLRKSDENEEEIPKAERRARFKRNLGLVGGALGLLVVLAGAVLLLGGDAPLTRGVGLTNPEDVSNGRLHFWSVALRIFLDYPILGAGLDAFGTAFPFYDTWNGNYRVEQAHNEYLQILADAGILGFICIAAFIFLLFKQGLQRIGAEHSHFRRSVSVGALAGCLGILIHSFFDFPLRTSSNAFFFLLFAVFATASIHFSKRSRTHGKR